MIYKRNASDFMTGSVIVAHANNTFHHVMTFFTTHKIQHLPVVDGDKLIGIISIKDMLGFFAKQLELHPSISKEELDKHFNIKEVMTPDPVTVEPAASQKEVLEILAGGKFQAVPVVTKGVIKGIITNKDISRIYKYDITHIL